jgi:simple sugar transport system ATP-binding protein
VHHAYPIGEAVTLLNRGRSIGTFTKDTITKDEVLDMMAGGAEMQKMIAELDGATI